MMKVNRAAGLAVLLAACTGDSPAENLDGSPSGSGGGDTAGTTVVTVAATTTGGATGPETTAASLARQQMANGWGPELCAATPNGEAVGTSEGEQIPTDLVFQDCEGNDVALSELCGADGVWMFFAHVWCPHCRLTGSFAEEVHDSFAGENLATVQIVVADGNGDPADGLTCQRWREAYGQTDVLTLIDPNGNYAQLVEENFTALNLLLDDDRIIQPKFHSDQRTGIENAIAAALAQ